MTSTKDEYTYEDIQKIAEYLKTKVSLCPKIGIICGSGLGSISESIKDAVALEYKDIPNFPVSTAPGHKGRLIFGNLSEVPVVCMQGRFHYYEGYPLAKTVMPVKVMKLLGVTHLIASNAAGGINKDFKVGDIMLIKDHINVMGMAGIHPLVGPNDERFGQRFYPMNNAYDRCIIRGVKGLANEMNLTGKLHEGVYASVSGPNYETIAELKALMVMGADAVGMSTVPEINTAKYCGLTCFAFSLITNACITDYESLEEPSGQEVIDVGKSNEAILKTFIEKVIKYIRKTQLK